MADMGLYLAALYQSISTLKLSVSTCGLKFLIPAPEKPQHIDVFDQQDIGRDLRHLARGKPKRQNTGFGLQARRAALNWSPPIGS